jgi:sterol desaturase/sphingolipid hydroxylase (fatty acid hydroxylase superfamily)
MLNTVALLENSVSFRLWVFVLIFFLLMLWEWKAPRRPTSLSRTSRWPANIGLTIINTFALRLLFPLGAIGLAQVAQQRGVGLFNVLASPPWLALLLSVLLMDFAVWVQHLLAHRVPVFWRLHQVHHADLDMDMTTGTRFHTLEILLSQVLKALVILTLGAPALAVLIFEVLLNATAMFNHANIRMPHWLDTGLRRFIVTPDMHRIHHSVLAQETNSNYGFCLSWWDYAFSSYRAQPQAGHQDMTIGQDQLRDPRQTNLLINMLKLPFRSFRS